jgi:aminopeptidase-like protein
VLNLSDGRHRLLDIAERAELPFAVVASAAETLEKHGLLRDSTKVLKAT